MKTASKNRNLVSSLSVAAMLACVAACATQGSDTPGLVSTPNGDMQGRVEDGVVQFRGIPFAAPPVGPLRWRPPEAPARWNGVFRATAFGKTCAQEDRGLFTTPGTNEDCLYLNVYAPASKPAAGVKRPVMVWFHGGGLFSGEGNVYDGSKLAKRGEVVVVTLNYRVGVLGFLSHPALNAEGHLFANYGIMDQQFALRWVQRNIAAFGGDPGNVTLFGQSGGGTSVLSNLQSPLSKGLFHKVINQSGTRIALNTPEMTLSLGQQFAAAAGCADQSAACLRSLPVEQILKNQAGIVGRVSDFPSVDGAVITQPAFAAFKSGNYNRVPIVNGLVLDEQAWFLPEMRTRQPLTATQYRERSSAAYGAGHVDMLMKKYPLDRYASPSLAEIAMAQNAKACTARSLDRQWARHAPVYVYQFEDRSAPWYMQPMSYPMRAYHTSELQFLFPMFHGARGTPQPLSDAQQRLSDMMVDYWTAFARTGNPNSPGNPAWAAYSPDQDNLQVLDLPAPHAAAGYGAANDCAMWDEILPFK